ncbi:GGDEF domain-containing protein [Dechloromonas sp. ZY10]|uniref:GGDEF domain-containing protein n=1 Tax=Dechloromonas aquae TaxID=2664436 RepID=UPI003526FDDF
MSRLTDMLWTRLTGMMPGELDRSEFIWLLSPHTHFQLLTRRRATMIVNRVRILALLFGVLTPLWTLIDYFVFPTALWLSLAALRISASIAFFVIVVCYKPAGRMGDAYRAIGLLFAVPTVFYVASHQMLAGMQLSGLSSAIATGYAFLPFVLLAGLSIFPLTVAESLMVSSPILLAHLLSGYLNWPTLEWPSYAGAFWLMTLITGVSALAGISQLAFMIALVRQAIRDPLTGAFSRRSGEEILELQFALAERNNRPFSVAFIDLDHFKSVNDSFGHESGDQLLRAAAQQLAGALRRSDTLVRWGGEEFILILQDTRSECAHQFLERIRSQGLGMRPDGSPVTASIGVAERTQDQCHHWQQLLELADRRMYHAKACGRDRVVGYLEQPEALPEPCPQAS